MICSGPARETGHLACFTVISVLLSERAAEVPVLGAHDEGHDVARHFPERHREAGDRAFEREEEKERRDERERGGGGNKG